MKKYFVSVILLLLHTLLLTSCLFDEDDEEWSASKVCPEAGTNRYGMPNRGTFIDERDGREYAYTTIGNQVWMAENLKYELPYPYSSCYGLEYCNLRNRFYQDTVKVCHRDTTNLPDFAQKSQSTCTDNDCLAKEYCEFYGRNYSLMDQEIFNMPLVDTICPPGWHVPSKGEWEKLIETMGGKQASKKLVSIDLKWTKDFYERCPYCEQKKSYGTDDCGYNLIPSEEFYKLWTTTLNGAHMVFYAIAYYGEVYFADSWASSHPIRCLKD